MVCQQIIKPNEWWLLEDAEGDGVAEVSVGRTGENLWKVAGFCRQVIKMVRMVIAGHAGEGPEVWWLGAVGWDQPGCRGDLAVPCWAAGVHWWITGAHRQRVSCSHTLQWDVVSVQSALFVVRVCINRWFLVFYQLKFKVKERWRGREETVDSYCKGMDRETICRDPGTGN